MNLRFDPRVGALASLALLALTALSGMGRAQEGGDVKSARLFEKSCASCHTVPDVRFETDKAWLGQVLETA
tara:strand:+ start:3491 stop:3703 length:213 start_codon:yes stop_codon:yes gene_type:complete